MTTSSTCKLLTALGFIMLMYIDMTTAPPPGLDCYHRKKRQAGGVCYRQQTYTYRQAYSTPCDYYRRKRARPWEDCGRTAYRMATGHRTVSSCCNGYEWDSSCNMCTASCPGGCYNGGTCFYGTCRCRSGYSGTRCETASCPGGCLNGGTCVGGTCRCRTGYSGTRCEVAPCLSDYCLNGGTCSSGTCRCRSGYSGTQCQTAQQDPVLTVTLTDTQENLLSTRITALLGATGGTFDPSRLNDKNIYNQQLINLNDDQQQIIKDSCSEASEIFAPSERKKRTGNRVCPGDQRTTSLVAFTGSGNRQVGQLVWLNEQTPWAFNEECKNYWGIGSGSSCRCEKVESKSKALVLVINIGQNNAGVDAVWKDVTIRHCAATYNG